MYWFHDADYRAAKAAMIASMDEGYPWHEAAAKAGVVVSRATAYRLWLRAWREGPTCLDDARHGHPSKLRDPIRQWLVETCTAAPTTSSPALQTAIHDRFGLTVSVRQINRVRAALGVRAVRATSPKTR
jgi:transposase